MSVKQINNLLALLEFFAEKKEPVTLAGVVDHFGWPRSSAYNILTTLIETGYLYEPKARGGYYPTPRWMQIVSSFSDNDPVPEVLQTIIRSLSETTGETVWICVASGQFAVVLDAVESRQAIRYTISAGKRLPIHVTASGQALLSCLPAKACDVILRRARYGCWGPNAAPDMAGVRAQMSTGAARGWYQSASYFSPDLGGVAVPVSIDDRHFSVTVAGPLFRVADKAEDHAAQILAALCARK
jgi:IclR family acetate operon transcriptional repressor